jgi:uncharacterized Zn finger protein (UPF0148 family)
MAKLLPDKGLMLSGECPDCGYPLYRNLDMIGYPLLPCGVCELRIEIEQLRKHVDEAETKVAMFRNEEECRKKTERAWREADGMDGD